MKKLLTACILACVISSVALCGFTFGDTACASITKGCKSAYLMDYDSGECIYKENETARMPIASVCKVMTLTLCFEAIDEGKIRLDDKITASERAAGMGGSQVFLDAGGEYTIDQLIKSIIVCSANDSCVAMAETVAGGEDEFVSKMNKKATDLGCSDTLFANCTGLPKETQYSCAKDVAIMFKNLLSHEKYYDYSKIWLEDFEHPNDRKTTMTNTNKLIKKYGYCDGGKTGFTNEAGFCLAATAKKNNMRLVSAVLGASSSDERFAATIGMFDYGFANYKNKIVLDGEINLNDEFAVSGGKKESFAVRPERNSYVFTKKDASPDITHNLIAYDVKAPVALNQVVGLIEVYKDGVICDKVNVVAAEGVDKANFGDYFKRVAREWAL